MSNTVLSRLWKSSLRLLVPALFACTVLLFSAHRGASDPDGPRILVLFSNQPALPANQAILAGLESALKTGPAQPGQIFYEYLDAVRFGQPDVEDATVAYFHVKYGKRRPNVVFAVGPQALIFADKRRSELFPYAALAFAAVGEEELPLGLPPRTPGILSEFNPLKSLELALQPTTRHVAVVTGASAFDKDWDKIAREKFKLFADKYDFVYLVGLPLKELIDRVRSLPPESVIIYLSMFEDGRGQEFIPRDIAEKIATAANAPVYSVYDTYVGTGIVGGYMDTFEAVGQQLGVLTNRLLKGEDPGSISPYEAETHRYIVDWRQLARWGIQETVLLRGSEIRFRTQSLWDEYRWQIVLLTAGFLGQTALIVGLFHQHRARRLAETEARDRMTELAFMNRRATAGEMTASIAHELNQPLTAILSNAEAAHDLLARKDVDAAKVQEIVADIIKEDTRAAEVMGRIRNLLKKGEHKAEVVNINQLVESTLDLLRGELVTHNVRVKTVLEANLPTIAGDPVQLQQVLINAIMNAIEAMGPTDPHQRKLKVMTRTDGNQVEAVIVDNGRGIAKEQQDRLFQPFFTTKEHGLGLGLSICSKIMAAHRRKMAIQSNIGGSGATVVISMPAYSEDSIAA